jgi:type I restriction enzyme R subunit
LNFVRDSLQAEEQRHIAEHLSEEELTVFDMLLKSEENGIPLTDKEREGVKRIVRTLLETLKREKLVLDWRKK